MDLNEFKKMYPDAGSAANNADRLEEAKKVLAPMAEKLRMLGEQKGHLELQTKQINLEMGELESQIRAVWGPLIVGATEAELVLENGVKLKSKVTLNVKKDDEDAAVKWLMANGYDGIMKYSCHTQTMYKIAKELYNSPEQKLVTGLTISEFPVIKVS